MKGVVFTEFLAFVRHRHGEDMADDVIEDAKLPSEGAYTAVGTYEPAEMQALCAALAARSGTPVAELLRDFGQFLSASFARLYPVFFQRASSYFDFLASIEGHIHVEVKKLYPDAELPSFSVAERSPWRMVLDYRSPRALGHLSEGLIEGSARQFNLQVQVRSQALDGPPGQAVRFVVDLV